MRWQAPSRLKELRPKAHEVRLPPREIACGWLSGGSLGARSACHVDLELLETQLQLRSLRIELLAGVTELHLLEACELQLELLDQHIA